MTPNPQLPPDSSSSNAQSIASHGAVDSSAVGSGPRIWVLVPCAGQGSRAGTDVPKQYQLLAGRPMVLHTLAALGGVKRVHQILVVVAPGDRFFREPVNAAHLKQLNATLLIAECGGSTRAASVLNGLKHLLGHGAHAQDWVLVHDAARCLVTAKSIDQLLDACEGDAVGGLLALPLPDTLKMGLTGRVAATLDRGDKWLAQTPQMFRVGALMEALTLTGDRVTDEASAIEAMGQSPKLVVGSAQNVKVTYPEDFALADAVLRARQRQTMRVGEGWDTHALVPGRKLILGGVEIPFDRGLQGHSDADVLLHAITDALLGAAALGDIGTHFPDTDLAFKGANSMVLIVEALKRVRARGYEVGNIDCTVIAQAPKLMPWIPAMQNNLAQALKLDLEQISIKAKTAEKMGPVGEGKAIEARASVLLVGAT